MYKGKSLLQHAADAAWGSVANPVVLVTGANADRVKKEITNPEIIIVENSAWPEGIASSIRSGLNTLLKATADTDAVILMVCDQPYIRVSILDKLISKHQETGLPVIVSRYGKTIGPPALFYKSLFAELQGLKGDAGARKVVERHFNEKGVVSFPKGYIDIDTTADYNSLLQ